MKETRQYRKYSIEEFAAFRFTMQKPAWRTEMLAALASFVELEMQGNWYGPRDVPYLNGRSDWACVSLPHQRATEYGWDCASEIVHALAELEGVGMPEHDEDWEHPYWDVYNRVEDHLAALDDTDPRWFFTFGGCDYLGPIYHAALREAMPNYNWRLRRSYQKNNGRTGHTTIVSHRKGVVFDLFVPEVGEALRSAGVKGKEATA